MNATAPHLAGSEQLTSVVGDLQSYNFSVPPDALGSKISELFEKRPDIPGLLIQDDEAVLGMVSRERFQRRLARKFGIELASTRPILKTFDGSFDRSITRMLLLEASCSVQNAVEACLRRDGEMIYEPIIVAYPDRPAALVDFHTLLLAQIRLLAASTRSAEEQKQIADEANRTKSNFLAHISHELRTPLTAIIGYTEIMQEDVEAQDFDELSVRLGYVHQASMHLLTIINSILDISKIEAGRLELFLEETSISDLINEAVSAVRPQMEANGNQLVTEVPSDPGKMFTDHMRVRQNLLNLLSNAAKFTLQGTVTLSVRRCFLDVEEWVNFSIKDTGLG